MKSQGLSFASVLKNKARSPQPYTKPTNFSLAELLEQWVDNQEEDYTLYLGNFNHSVRSYNSSNRMISSKNPAEDEEMFDSWIQRQSSIIQKITCQNRNKKTQRNSDGDNESNKKSQFRMSMFVCQQIVVSAPKGMKRIRLGNCCKM